MSEKIKRFVLFTEKDGVYLGSAMGLGFWSKLDPVGQTHACTFESETDATEYIKTWDQQPSETIEIKPVMINAENKDMSASMSDISDAGMPTWDID